MACARGAAGVRGAGTARRVAAGASISVCCTLVGSSSAAVVPCSAAATASAKAVRAAVPDVATKVRSPAACNTPVALKLL